MPRKSIFSLEGPVAGVTITCDSGTVWITQAGDGKDYIVSAGMNFTARGKGSVVVQLSKDARITVRRPDEHPRRLRHWLSKRRHHRAADSRFRRICCLPTLRGSSGSARPGSNCL